MHIDTVASIVQYATVAAICGKFTPCLTSRLLGGDIRGRVEEIALDVVEGYILVVHVVHVGAGVAHVVVGVFHVGVGHVGVGVGVVHSVSVIS